MLERLSRARRNLVLLALLVLSAWFFWSVRSVLNPLLCGYLLAYILLPLVARMERRGLSRRAAVNLIFAAGFCLALLVLVALVWQLRALVSDVYESAKASATAQPGQGIPLHESLQHRADEFTATLRGWGLEIEDWPVPDLEGLRVHAQTFLAEYGDQAGRTGLSLAGGLLSFLARFLGGVFWVVALFFLVPLYTYYFLFVIGDVHGSVQRYFPRRERARLTRVAERIGEMIASFFRGRLAVAFLKGLLLAIGLTIADMPYGFLFGMLSGALSIIPFAGALSGFLLTFAVGILDRGVIDSAWRAGLVFGVAEVLEGYVLLPRILGDRLGLHPLVVFFALLAGGAALGMLGLLIALPVTAALVILFQEFVSPALKQFADESG
ncbi:MAG: AI-2E family transporter [Planctomycetes bacterium]|nr:AI-2E family transporter [Planctomycetota bacterium]